MRYFLDTEFNEFGGELISLGLVSASGKELYFELDTPITWRPWVEQHVKPLLTGPKVGREVAQKTLAAYFITDASTPVIICDWPADIAHFCSLLDLGFGKRLGVNRWEFILQDINSTTKPDTPHHALSDARALRKSWLEQNQRP